MVALEADGGDAVLDVEPFGIDQPFLVDRLAVPSTICSMRKLDARRPPVAVTLDRAVEPEAGVGDADEIAARRREAKRRQRAEIASGEVISSPPTNSSGPNGVSLLPIGTR